MLALAGMSQKPLFVDLLRLVTNPTAALSAIHNKHGDLVQTTFINKNLAFVSNPEHYEEVFNLEAKGLIGRDSLYDAKKPVFGDGIFNSGGDTWTNQRRLMQPLFTKDAVTSWQETFIAEANRLVEQLKVHTGGEVNLSKEFKKLVQNIMVKIMFGRDGSSAKDLALINTIDTIVGGLFFHLVTETLGKGKFKYLFVVQNWRMEKAMKQFCAFVYEEIERKQDEPPGKDFISMLNQSINNKTGYTMTKELLINGSKLFTHFVLCFFI